MTDRLFADCCYGTDLQHGLTEPCPTPDDLNATLREWGCPYSILDSHCQAWLDGYKAGTRSIRDVKLPKRTT